MSIEPYQQGSLDGLCGLYSVINTARLVIGKISEEECYDLFYQSLLMLEQKQKISDFVYQGTNNIAYLFRVVDKKYPTKRSKPFHTAPNTSLATYWNAVRVFLNNGPNRAVFIGIGDGGCGHWSVVKDATEKRFVQFDSWKAKHLLRRRCTTRKRTKVRPYLLYPTMTYFVSRL